MVRHNFNKSIPDRLSPGSTRTAPGAGVPGHLVASGQQDSGSSVEQPGLKTAKLMEEMLLNRKKYTEYANKEIMICYYKSNPTRRGYLKRMYQIWKEKHPDTEITEQRLADQRRYIIRNKVFTGVELEELQRATQAQDMEEELPPTEAVAQAQVEEVLEIEDATVAELFQNQNQATSPLPSPQKHKCRLTEKQQELKQKITEHMNQTTTRVRLPALKTVAKKQLAQVLKDANAALAEITTNNLQETNQLMYSAATITTQELRYKINGPVKKESSTSPKWKIRLENKISRLRSDASKLKDMKDKKLKNKNTKQYLIQKYHLDSRKIREVLEIIKQQITAVSKKISRYEARTKQHRQNLQFQSNQRRFYQSIEGETARNIETPNKEETVQFWGKLWDNPIDYNKKAGWMKEVKKCNQQMQDLIITPELISERAKKIKNWTAPGDDELHGFWLKHLTSLHKQLSKQFNHMLQGGDIEQWLTTGKTHLIMKDPAKGAVPSNYRPITCLPTMFKLLTGIIADEVMQNLLTNKQLPVEQKGNCPNTRGTKDQLLIDKMILENCKRRKTNLSVAWIDYKKAFNSLPHTWILKCLETTGVSKNIQIFI
ncbi:uncharacterized protein LOC128340565 [Hemicordylus capensis]|uniref:uncharacterized protein LOC128340565 n=1 Tax=Hemicordylus capensis TaxID=884348 RepID=UPI002304610D|nr:uncharacterized protein LOC128340565 [Hemicordylus capensis]